MGQHFSSDPHIAETCFIFTELSSSTESKKTVWVMVTSSDLPVILISLKIVAMK
jgi:hypothetical protein